MWFNRRPTVPPTPFEYGLIAVILCGVLIVGGVVGLAAAALAPAEKADVAGRLVVYGGWSLGLGIVLAAAYWLFRRLMP
jgi:uncharacterized membrane protein YedE/YeeE